MNFILGTGLHSYGFGTERSEQFIAAFVGLDLLFVAIAVVRAKSTIQIAQIKLYLIIDDSLAGSLAC